MPHFTLSWSPHRVAAGNCVEPFVSFCCTPLYQKDTQPAPEPEAVRDSLKPMTNVFHVFSDSGAFQMCWSEPVGEVSWKCSWPSPRVRSTNGPALGWLLDCPEMCSWNSEIQAPFWI